jgi:hypothetical protein
MDAVALKEKSDLALLQVPVNWKIDFQNTHQCWYSKI